MTPALAWRLVIGAGQTLSVPDPLPGARNMAIDQALLESVAEGASPAIRFYRWRPACLSFGRNQPARDIYDPERARMLGVDVVRRPTGGLAVLHAAELTYAVVAPVHLLGGPRGSYGRINEALAEGLRSLGVPAELSAGPRRGAAAQAFATAAPCFELPAAGELMAHGQKLVGSAQRVERRTLLQHGSILVDGTQADLQALQRHPAATVAGATTLRQVLGYAPGWDSITASLAAAFERLTGTALAPGRLEVDELARARTLETRFADHAWTWRR